MNPPFAPTFQDLQKDTERHLERAGMTEKNEHGQTVYRGYYKALSQMFRLYIEKEAFAPLVAEFRRWNWEWDYGDDLMAVKQVQNGRWVTVWPKTVAAPGATLMTK